MRHPRTRLLLALVSLPLVNGCALLGVAANAMPQKQLPAKVTLAGKSVGVMVWCDRGLRAAWPSVQGDLGNGIQQRLQIAQKAGAKDVKDIRVPYPAASFVRWQRDHPEVESEPIALIAPRLHVERLVYIELNDLQTRVPNAVALYRGSVDASLKVFACDSDTAPAKLLYEERIKATYPKASTDDGRPDSSDDRMYVGVLTRLADAVATRFVEHPEEDEQ